MVYDKNKQNNAKQQNGGQQQINDPNAPAQKVVEAARQSYAMQHGGVMPSEQKPMSGAPGGNIPAVGTVAQPMNFFGNGGGVQGAYDYTPNTPAPAPEYGTQGVQITDPADTKQNDLGGLSQALANAGGQPQQAQFQADPTQRDGGFFGWLGGLIPKNRPGLRDGETPDEYDDRMARNTKMYFTLADALRHLGNIVNTSKYAPLQQFNDPNAMIEQRYQQRKAERQKQAAMDAKNEQKAADLALKKIQIDSQKAYKEYLQQMGTDKLDWQKDKDKRDYNYKVGQDEIQNQIKIWDKELKEKNFNEKQRHDIIMEAIGKLRASKSGSSGGRGGSGATPRYTTYDAEGKPHYAWNQTMWEQDQAYYNGNTAGKSSTSNSKEVLNKDGSSTRVTSRQGGSSLAQKAGMQRRQREEAARQKGKGNSSAPKGKGKLGGKKYH